MRVCPRCSTETLETLCPDDGAPTIEVQDSGPVTYPSGTVIADRYRVDAVLGIGGFGAVYRCTQLNMSQTVAVKVLRNEHLQSVEHVKRFTREAQAASKLNHPNTIHIFDFGQNKDAALYLAMEFVEGETLGHRLDEHVTIHWETLIHIMTQVCHSLTEAHAAGLIHRDLKPENIMLVQVAGDPNFVKVLDFGIAKVMKDSDNGQSQLTESGMIMGTPTYMSPEQAKGEAINGRSDVYSLGVMMYEALTGKPPFQGDTPMTVLVSHIKDIPRPMPRDGSIPNVPPELEKVVLSCLEKDPAKRPQTAVQLVGLLVQAGKAVREPQATTVSRAPLDAGKTTGLSAVETGMVEAPVLRPPTPIAMPQPVAPVNRAPLYIGLGAFAAVALLAVAVALLAGNRPTQGATPPAAVSVAPQPAPPPTLSGSAVAQPASEPVRPAPEPPRPTEHPVPAVAIDKPHAPDRNDRAVAEKAAADKAAAERAEADRLAAERLATEKAARDKANQAAARAAELAARKDKAAAVDKPVDKVEHKVEHKADPNDFKLDPDDPPKK
jgi:predicted Ser/Thr protein kinase